MADFRSRILAAIDSLRRDSRPATADDVMGRAYTLGTTNREARRIPAELRAMAKAGLVVYDRKASGWRRA